MSRCFGCGKFLSTSSVGGARCTVCPGLYHKACIGVPEAALISTSWICPECKMKMPKSGNSATPVKHASSDYHLDSLKTPGDPAQSKKTDGTMAASNESETGLNDEVLQSTQPLDLGLEIRLFREELREVRKELREFRNELFDMRNAVTGCNRRIDDIEGRLGAIEKGANELGLVESSRVEQMGALEKTVALLQEHINERDQELLQADVEITNVPEVKGENPVHTITVLAAKLGLELTSKDIIFAERVGRTNDSDSQLSGVSRGRRLVARLARRSQRDELLHGARVRRGVTTADMGIDAPARRFYVNERLTRKNRHLFYLARDAARKMEWKYTWTKRGRIYARKGEGQPVHCVKVEADIARVFGVVQVGGD